MDYRPPNGNFLMFQKQLRNKLSKNSIANKSVISTSDFKINLLDSETNKKVWGFVNFLFIFRMISTVNKTTHITQ